MFSVFLLRHNSFFFCFVLNCHYEEIQINVYVVVAVVAIWKKFRTEGFLLLAAAIRGQLEEQ